MENMIINGATVKPIDGIVVSRDSFGQANSEIGRTSHRISIVAQPEDRNVYLSDFFNQTPYGLIDKRATGIGATELEICAKRKSVLVFPTRALAVSKCRKAEKDFKEKGIDHLYGLFYVGGLEDDTISVENRFQIEWDQQPEKHDDSCYTKLFVVADSLDAALGVARIDEEEGEYFLLVDEVDTYQIDSTYRTRLADVVDTYFRWNHTCRAMVSATFRHKEIPVTWCDRAILYPLPAQSYNPDVETLDVPHSMLEGIRTEPWTIIEYDSPVKPEFKLRYTSDIQKCIIATIHEIADTTQKGKTILVAFNNVKNISDIINKLKKQRNDLRFGVLFSERAEKKDIEEYRISPGQFDGYLRKNEDGDSTLVVFMTCAYYVGIDIYDEGCHLIMVSAFNNDFSLLSVERIEQIRGRLRHGSASNTIIYNSWECVQVCKYYVTKDKRFKYKSNADRCSDCKPLKIPSLQDRKNQEDSYLQRATLIADLQNSVSELLKATLPVKTEHTINRISSILNDAVKETDMDAVPLTRRNSEGKFIPYYLNLDAMVDQWNTKYRIYGNRSNLEEALRHYYNNVTVTKEPPYFPVYNRPEHVKAKDGSPSSNNGKKEANSTDTFKVEVKALFNKLRKGKTDNEKHKLLFKYGGLYLDGPISNFKKTIHTYLEYLSLDDMEMLADKFVFDDKNKNTSDLRHLKKFHAALGFMLLEDSHPFKEEVLTSFGYPSSSLPELRLKKPILITDRNERMMGIIKAFKPDIFIPPSRQANQKRKDYAEKKNKKIEKDAGLLVECFFEKTNSNNQFRIKGLYPKAFKTPDGREILQVKDEKTKIPITPIKRIHPEEGEDFISKYFLPKFTQ